MRSSVLILGLVSVSALVMQRQPPASRTSFSVVETSILDMQEALEAGRTTSRHIVQEYLARIAMYEDILNAAISVNPRALDEADERDRERRARRIRGPLHGIPVALKDNIHVNGMRTTGGTLAFADLVPPYEATLTRNLRDAGAIILAKTGLTELANWVAGDMPNHYNALAGFGMNPYDPRADPRFATFDRRPALDPGGSSSGIGTAANFWAANVGTETSGSILTPASQTMLVGIKPTVGRISRYGVIPITADQDTPGPMAKTVGDAALVFGALESSQPDPHDPATKACVAPSNRDYTQFLRPGALNSARIGIPRTFFYESRRVIGIPPGGLTAAVAQVMSDALAILREQGAVIVDPADIPSVVESNPNDNLMQWLPCAGPGEGQGADMHCSIVFKYGMKRDFNRWLATLGSSAPVGTLTALRHWNDAHARAGAVRYGQSRLDISDEIDEARDRQRYEADRAKDVFLARTRGLDVVLKRHNLDAILFPGASGAFIAARAGYPTVIVPFGFVPNEPIPSFPSDFDAKPSPFGVSFTGAACSEPRLIALAYDFEQATKRRVPPPLFP